MFTIQLATCPTRFLKRLMIRVFPFLFFTFLLKLWKDKWNYASMESQKDKDLVRSTVSHKTDQNMNLEYTFEEMTESKDLSLLKYQSTPLQYTTRAFREPTLRYRTENLDWKSWGPKLKAVKNYFQYLRIPQINCSKLKRMGGTISCKQGQGDANNMDGHKYICMDPPLMLAHTKGDPKNCLTLSFGTQIDTSFDDEMSELPCEVHLFDVLDYDPPLARESRNVYFHVEGLAGSKGTVFFNNINKFVAMDTLRGHVDKKNLTTKVIHVLKVDIENGEWEVFKNIANDPIFDAVGQIALEVHALDVVKGLNTSWSANLAEDKWLKSVQERYDVLRAIEARGFRRVLYWDNVRDKYPYFDEEGLRYETSGEMLYINTHWYESDFMERLRSRGYVNPIM